MTWVPSCLPAGAHTLHIWSSLLQVWELARKGSQAPVPCRPSHGHHPHQCRIGERGTRGGRGRTAGSRVAPEGRAASRKPLSLPVPRQRRPPALPCGRCAPASCESQRPNRGAAPHRRRRRVPGAGATAVLGGASPFVPGPSPPGSAERAPAPPASAKPTSRTAEETFARLPASRSPPAGTVSREPMRKSAGESGAWGRAHPVPRAGSQPNSRYNLHAPRPLPAPCPHPQPPISRPPGLHRTPPSILYTCLSPSRETRSPIRLFFFSEEKLVQRRSGPGYLLQHTEEEESEEGSDRGRRERLLILKFIEMKGIQRAKRILKEKIRVGGLTCPDLKACYKPI
ncbi:uncharacterized protein [Callorhinus ursinus]|uniref:uncharacterized protein n=1 Tax=Callorhinus ursinus TaxID=34884 RepID=UPI003CD00606